MLKIKLQSFDGYKDDNLKKLQESVALLETTLNGDPFRDTVLSFKSEKTEGGTFHFIMYTKWRGRRIELERFTNQEIFDKVMQGNETGGTDSFIIYNLTLEKGAGGSTVGYTDSKGNIHTYTSDFHEMSAGEFAAHLFHEYTHTIDFSHSPSNRNDKLRDCYSVPYALGNFVEIILTGECAYGCKY
jgi:hypothetical protein